MNTGDAWRRIALVTATTMCLAAAPASAQVVVNEVESNGPGGAPDWVELYNTGGTPVDLTGWTLKDDGNGNDVALSGSIAAGGFRAFDVTGLGGNDQARLLDAGAVVVDSHVWTTAAVITYARNPDGTGGFAEPFVETKGFANDFTVATAGAAWPGGADVAAVDDAGQFNLVVNFADTGNMSGLAYQPSGTSAPGVLWAVRNNPSTLYRLIRSGGKWVFDPGNGWGQGKRLRYPGGTGNPDTEGIAFGADGSLYASTERDGANDQVSRPGVLRFDITSAAAELTATHDFVMTADQPGLGRNDGLEAVAFVPDADLVAKGFRDQSTGAVYDPARYPGHGGGLFFVGVEQTARVIVYALDHATGTVKRVSSFASGLQSVMELHYEPETKLLWVLCDNTCEGRSKTFDVAAGGGFGATATYERPAGMANRNNEGFTIAPQAECAGGLKPAFWLDDDAPGPAGNALRVGTVRCTVPVTTPPGGGGGGGGGGTTPPGVVAPPVIVDRPAPRDTTRPVLSRLRATRRAIGFRLSERARVRVVVARRVGRRFRTVRAFTVPAVAAGTRSIVFRGRIPASVLRRGTLRISLQATDAAGNRSATARRTVGR